MPSPWWLRPTLSLLDMGIEYRAQMTFTHGKDPVRVLAAHRADPSLREGTHPWRLRRVSATSTLMEAKIAPKAVVNFALRSRIR